MSSLSLAFSLAVNSALAQIEQEARVNIAPE
eukprot:CAMPEP_0178441808 /NCGR_PEP_ID=MMETSP0689_2-20121128/37722_1 /TAXON_ID=160604 /ORGANISM="Amphidinium massartii, Strain CS-259" /LENGTH=30 /DNA_ID= /DNA_START= /DNA_END= /DNA_ORIENTATION=